MLIEYLWIQPLQLHHEENPDKYAVKKRKNKIKTLLFRCNTSNPFVNVLNNSRDIIGKVNLMSFFPRKTFSILGVPRAARARFNVARVCNRSIAHAFKFAAAHTPGSFNPTVEEMSILKIVGRQILDSRGNPTVEVDLVTHKGTCSLLFSNLFT